MTGGTPSTKDEANYLDGDIPWIVSGDIHKGEISEAGKRITKKGMNESPAKFLPVNSVLIALNGQGKTRGTVALLRISGATCNQSIVAIIPKSPGTLDYHYLYVTLRSMYQQLRDLTGDKNRAGLNMGLIGKIQVPLPPLTEQIRIAGILDAADALRAKRRESLAQLDTLLQSTFLDVFGDPVTNPMGWPVRPMGDLVENKDSMRVPVKKSDRDRRSGKYPYYGSVGVIDDIDDFLFEGQHLLVSEDGKHLETRSRPITCLADGRFWVNNHAHVLAFNGKADLKYLAHYLENRPIRQYVTGIDQFKLNRKKMDVIPTPLPPLDIQNRFNTIVESVEQQKIDQRTYLAELDTLFASLQSRAFRGEL